MLFISAGAQVRKSFAYVVVGVAMFSGLAASALAASTDISGDATSSSFTFAGPISISTLTASNLIVATGTVTNLTATTVTATNVFGVTGRLVQTKSTSYSTNTNTTSTSFQDTGLSSTFTPTSVTSTMVVVACQTAGSNRSGNVLLRIVRDTTDISGTQLGFYFNSDTNLVAAGGGNICIVAFDNPETTSSLTYKTQFKSSQGQTVFVNGDNTTAYTNLLRIMEFR